MLLLLLGLVIGLVVGVFVAAIAAASARGQLVSDHRRAMVILQTSHVIETAHAFELGKADGYRIGCRELFEEDAEW